jgi:NADPH:quinone reductase-like Zn-dependent oxidoreductase
MPKAVRFDHYGDVDVLEVVDVPRPEPGANELLIRVRAAGINPGEAKIREGLLAKQFPATFPSGQGSDLAGVIEETGSGVTGWAAGDQIIGFTEHRAAQAEFVVVEASDVVAKPPNISWEVAGSVFVAGTTAYAAVRAVAPQSGETVLVAGATGGVGSIAVQLARRTGATVVGIASESHHAWLTAHGVVPVAYGDGLDGRLREAVERIDACIDTVGGEYVELALAFGVPPSRIDTIANFDAVRRLGVKGEGNAAGANSTVLGEVVSLIAEGALEVPIAATYPLDQVRDAYRRLAGGHILGKIVLLV